MKYLFIDTNIYIQCCLLELEGDNLETLNELEKLLEKNKVKLLLPEVVELEFYNVLENKFNQLKKKVGLYQLSIKKDKELDEKIKKDLMHKLDECIRDREKNAEKVKKKMEEIFKNKKFTVKKELIIKEKYLINAYKAFLSGEKPYKKEAGIIQPDCVIIETLVSYFQNRKEYELFFCSSNKWDFAQNPKAKNGSKIHDDIVKRFKHIKYYENLFKLLNEKFGGEYSKESIEKLKEKEVEVYRTSPVIDGPFSVLNANNSRLNHLNSMRGAVFLGNQNINGVRAGSLMNEGKHFLNAYDVASINSEDNLLDIKQSYSVFPKKYCRKCGREYENDYSLTIDDGLCEKCRRGDIFNISSNNNEI